MKTPLVVTITLLAVMLVDTGHACSGNITAQLRPYSSEMHLRMLRKNDAASLVTRRTPADEVLEIATPPKKSACTS